MTTPPPPPAPPDPLPPRKSLRVQLWAVIGLLLIVFAGTIGFTFQQLELRKHDYLILNLTGQLRVNQRLMLTQAHHYLQESPDDYAKYGRDLGLYWQDLQKQMTLAGEIVGSLSERRLSPALTGRDEAIQCDWDPRSRSQMAHTANDWANFRSGLDVALGTDPREPRLTAAAEYIGAQGGDMAASADRLALAFQTMMEGKLDLIRYFQIAAGLAALLLLGLIALAADRRVLRPLQETVAGFQRVARGALGHQLPATADNEIGRMTVAFNALSSRLSALFGLTDRINRGTHLDQMLNFVLQEFRALVPVDWVGVLYYADDASGCAAMHLERMAGIPQPWLRPGECLPAEGNALAEVARARRPLAIPDLAAFGAERTGAELARRLAGAGLGSALYLPLSSERAGAAGLGVMVFAAHATAAYTEEHTELLGNIAGQIGHILDKTVVTEGLVVAAVEGLARLAESRDPETGDHLLRMARYSAIVAEELGREGPYREEIDATFVRDVLRFAPMHDIGKVGIADRILLKPGRLDEAERHEMERHPAIGAEVLSRCEAQMNALGHSIFKVGIDIAVGHHEKFDGSGYPAGLVGTAIPLAARIIAVADVFDALTSKRPYKEAWPLDKALALLDEAAGHHFDPAIVAAFHRALPQVMVIYERYKHT